MERKELESETIGSWDGDIAEYTDLQDYYLKTEADSVMDAQEARIKELEEKNTELKYQIENFTQGELAFTLEYKLYHANERIKELEERNKSLENRWENAMKIIGEVKIAVEAK